MPKKSTFEVSENGTYILKDYEYNDEQTASLLLETVNGTWKSLGNSMYEMPLFETPEIPEIYGMTITLDKEVKATFVNKETIVEFTGSVEFEGVTVPFSIRMILIADEDYVPDSIIGKWQLNEEFQDGIPEELTDCQKTMTIEFKDDGTYEEKDFNEEGLECVPIPAKNGIWINFGSDMYGISDIDIPEIKITFEVIGNEPKMTVEFSQTINDVTTTDKIIFIKVTS